ncbi:hypothetical protein PUN28_007408 [Cardiocondyla obscurior]|uniref:Uncharacterized protein n=1 Tax=Cardiocondyla obscurior TaxID=286306 RepID=A0AAW2G5D1_9HYME
MCIYDWLPYKDLYTALSMLTHRLNVSLESLSRDTRNLFVLQDYPVWKFRSNSVVKKKSHKIDDLALLMILHNHDVCTDNMVSNIRRPHDFTHVECRPFLTLCASFELASLFVYRRIRYYRWLFNTISYEHNTIRKKNHVGVKRRSISVAHVSVIILYSIYKTYICDVEAHAHIYTTLWC